VVNAGAFPRLSAPRWAKGRRMIEAKKKKSLFDSFIINDRKSCGNAIKNGGIAAMISAIITGVFSVSGFFTTSSNKALAYMLDPWGIFDAILCLILAILIFRKSRVASTLLVLYFAASKAIIWYDTGKFPGYFGIIFFLFYITAMRGTFIWHSTYKDILPAIDYEQQRFESEALVERNEKSMLSCSFCDFSINGNEFKGSELFCPECGSRLKETY
jgi:hypothetical protein